MVIYCLVDTDGKPRYVGWSADPDRRLREHWKQRRAVKITRSNPAFAEWLQGMLIPPAYKILAVVPWDDRYQAERRYTLAMRQKYPLVNISAGAAPIRRPWMSTRNPGPHQRLRSSATLPAAAAAKHRGAAVPSGAAA